MSCISCIKRSFDLFSKIHILKKAFNRSIGKVSSLGKVIDRELIETYPENADICGKNGEYHSFVRDGPIFKKPVDFQTVRKHYTDYIDRETNRPHRYYYLELK